MDYQTYFYTFYSFFVDITIAPIESASIIFILVPYPNIIGTHIHFEKNIKLYILLGTIFYFESVYTFYQTCSVKTSFIFGNIFTSSGIIDLLSKSIDSLFGL